MLPRSTYPRLIVIFSVSGAFAWDCFAISIVDPAISTPSDWMVDDDEARTCKDYLNNLRGDPGGTSLKRSWRTSPWMPDSTDRAPLAGLRSEIPKPHNHLIGRGFFDVHRSFT